MELVDRVDIQKYAKRNTSPNMPIEAKYVQAFIDALMNSTSLQELYDILRSETQNGDSYLIYNSYGINARNINKEPYRSIIAYAMLKKDFRLFQLISASMFTGSVKEYHGSDLYDEFIKTTDETPLHYTDEGTYTDMNEGLIQIGFKNYYCNDPLPDGTGSEYQTVDELLKSLTDFDYIITLTKPARVEVLLFFVPFCFLSGDKDTLESVGIKLSEDPTRFSAPFGDELSMNILENMSDKELMASYSQVSMYDYDHNINRDIRVDKSITVEPGCITFDYDLRCQASSSSTEANAKKDIIWGTIKIISNVGNKTYAESKSYRDEEEYYEKYIPIMLRNGYDKNNPSVPSSESPCLPYEIVNGVPTIGALLYERERRQ